MTYRNAFYLLAAACLVSPQALSEPLHVKNLSPVVGLLGLPSQRGPVSLQAHAWQVATHASWASHFVVDDGPGESLLLDGETRRLALAWRYAPAPDRWDLQLELPWLQHTGGNLDSLIDGWHDLWGMPDGGRDHAPGDRLAYRYAGPKGAFNIADDASGPGDISLSLSRRLWSGGNGQLDAALGVKLPTGEEKDFLGSGSEDGFLALRGFWAPGGGDWRWSGQLGYLCAGEISVLEGAAEDNLWFAGASLEWQAWSSLSLLLQLDSHAAPLKNSDLTALGDTALLLSAGARWRINPHWALEFSVVEDVQVESGPDVVFQAGLRYRP